MSLKIVIVIINSNNIDLLFNKYFLSTYIMPGPVARCRKYNGEKNNHDMCTCRAQSPGEDSL